MLVSIWMRNNQLGSSMSPTADDEVILGLRLKMTLTAHFIYMSAELITALS